MKISLNEEEIVELISASMEDEYEKMPSRFTESSFLIKKEDSRLPSKFNQSSK